jgi:hypothetical protein
VEKAILLSNIRFWLKIEATDLARAEARSKIKDYYGKKYVWTYNSATSFSELLPYLKAQSISRWLRELETS